MNEPRVAGAPCRPDFPTDMTGPDGFKAIAAP